MSKKETSEYEVERPTKEPDPMPLVKASPGTTHGSPAVQASPGRPDRKEDVKKVRRRREGMGVERNQRLNVPEKWKDPNFHYHWINETPGRIMNKTEQDDYDIVTEEEMRGEKLGTGEGTQVKRAVGTGADGQWQYAYLCRKPKDFYKTDKLEEQAEIAKKMDAIKHGSAEGLDKDDQAYTPRGHQNVIE